MKGFLALIHLAIGVSIVILWISWPELIYRAQQVSIYISNTFGDLAQFFFRPFHIVFFILGFLTGLFFSKSGFLFSFFQVLPSFILFGLLNFSDVPFYLKILYGISLVMSSLLGAYLGVYYQRRRRDRGGV
ncbi:hypothetical protein [Microbulbifer donghaiensis]|uniref:hypothetical protein n=1 Tax=Microbulbifer donghaiensis TaxID=494016 RepID=UPI00093420E7|nr:hypothetical protein [Microbulbifer donghaiensis]